MNPSLQDVEAYTVFAAYVRQLRSSLLIRQEAARGNF